MIHRQTVLIARAVADKGVCPIPLAAMGSENPRLLPKHWNLAANIVRIWSNLSDICRLLSKFCRTSPKPRRIMSISFEFFAKSWQISSDFMDFCRILSKPNGFLSNSVEFYPNRGGVYLINQMLSDCIGISSSFIETKRILSDLSSFSDFVEIPSNSVEF